MRTIEEIRACAEKFPTTEVMGVKTGNLDRYPFEKLITDLKEDEDIIITFPAAAGTVGKTRLQRMAVAITNKRLILSGKPNMLFGGHMEAGIRFINLDKVNSTGVNGMTVRIDTIGDEDCMFGNYKPEIREELARNIRDIIDEYHSAQTAPVSQTVVQQKSSAEQIKEYKNLLDEGIITQEEYDAKKKQLLGL